MRLPLPIRSSSPSEAHAGDASDQNAYLEESDQSAYLEELVSIAVASARQAEDAARQVGTASVSARRLMFTMSAFGAIGILTGIAGILGARFSSDISGLLLIGGSKFAVVDNHQPTEPRGVVVAHPPPETPMQPRPPPSDGSPRDVAMLPRPDPPLISAAAQVGAFLAQPSATSEKDAFLAQPFATSEKAPQSEQVAPRDNARAVVVQTDLPPLQSGPTAAAPAKLAGMQTVEITRSQAAPAATERRGASSALAPVRVTTVTPSKHWHLVAAVQALEALTNSEGEPGAPP